MERQRTDSTSSSGSSTDTSSISGIPITLRRQESSDSSEVVEQQAGPSRAHENDTKSILLDFSFLELELPGIESNLSVHEMHPEWITTLNLSGNRLESLPSVIDKFSSLQVLDISQNLLTNIPEGLNNLSKMSTLIASQNHLSGESFSKDFGVAMSSCLKVLNLGGNELIAIPYQILQMTQLRNLYLGSNRISEVPREICRLDNLRVLYLGGNQLTSIPEEVGLLHNLTALSLCENRLQSLPRSIALLKNLKALGLHKNLLTALPPDIVKLRGLHELSLRDNPLVSRFVRDFNFDCPSLLELAARSIKSHKVTYQRSMLPNYLVNYLETARRCVNPKCKGVYFDARVEHIKFVDFCGIYRLPLLEYLCSPSCTSHNPWVNRSNSSDSESDSSIPQVPPGKLKRVLLG